MFWRFSPLQIKKAGAITFFMFCICAFLGQVAWSFDTKAKAAYAIDLPSVSVLLSKNSETPLPPASMSKLMTLYMAFEFIRAGRLKLDEKLPVSDHAASYGGSTMFLDTSDRVTVEDLLRGIIVLSGNDACAVIAEALSPDGTEAGFATMMTQRAKQLGMTQSTFTNSNGWPQIGHAMSAHDLGLLASALIKDFPEFYPLFAEQRFEFDGRAPANTQNRNPLLKLQIGADGLKTGHTKEAGYGLVGSAVQGERRIVFVLSGLGSARERAEEAEAMVNWAFRQFSLRPLRSKGTPLALAPVWNGSEKSVALSLNQDLQILVPVMSKDSLTLRIEYKGPIPAPIKQGDKIADLIVSSDGLPDSRYDLFAATSISVGGFSARLRTAAITLKNMLIDGPEAAF